MKKKIIYLSLASTLAIPQGGAMEDVGATEEHVTGQAAQHHSNLRQEEETVKHLIGGATDVPVKERLEEFTKSLSANAATLEDAVDSLSAALKGIPGNDLVEKIKNRNRERERMAEERRKEEATNKALQRTLDVITDEQRGANELLDQVLHLIPQETAPLPPIQRNSTSDTNVLSSYQRDLLSRRQQHEIGDRAWELLGGENPRLAAALLSSIQGYPGQTVDVFYVGDNNFTLRIDGKGQDTPYKF